MIEGHGDDKYRYPNIKIDFSSNICVHKSHQTLMTHLASHPELIDHYPEPEAWSLEAVIAERYGIEPEQVIVTNGATEAIYLIAQTFGMQPVIPTPTFSEYEDACNMYPRSRAAINLPAGEKRNGRMLWLCNPNNPTGQIIPLNDIEKIVKKAREYGIIAIIVGSPGGLLKFRSTFLRHLQ